MPRILSTPRQSQGAPSSSEGIAESCLASSRNAVFPIQVAEKQQEELAMDARGFLSAALKPLNSQSVLFFLLKQIFWYF